MINVAPSCRDTLVDSHCHLHFAAFDGDREAVLERARRCGVATLMCVGVDPEDSRRAIDVATHFRGVWASVGIHPQLALSYGPAQVRDLAAQVQSSGGRVVAVGETGFDLYRTPKSAPQQEALFIAHIELARRLGLPLIIHDREAHTQTLRVLDAHTAWSLGGVIHCFSGDRALAENVTDRGFLLSVSGVVTYRRAERLREAVAHTPLTHLLVETDAPYLTPLSHQGQRNEPAFVGETLEAVARIKGVDPEEMARITQDNFKRVFLSKAKGRPL